MKLHPAPSSKSRSFGKKTLELRNAFFGDIAGEVWSRHGAKGFTTIPRILSLVLSLIGELGKKGGNPSRVYFDLWCRSWDYALIQITDEQDMAYSSGYTGTRAVRSWREHILSLTDSGFILTKELGNRDVAFVVIRDPYKVVFELQKQGKVPTEWWNAFMKSIIDSGVDLSKYQAKSQTA